MIKRDASRFLFYNINNIHIDICEICVPAVNCMPSTSQLPGTTTRWPCQPVAHAPHEVLRPPAIGLAPGALEGSPPSPPAPSQAPRHLSEESFSLSVVFHLGDSKLGLPWVLRSLIACHRAPGDRPGCDRFPDPDRPSNCLMLQSWELPLQRLPCSPGGMPWCPEVPRPCFLSTPAPPDVGVTLPDKPPPHQKITT